MLAFDKLNKTSVCYKQTGPKSIQPITYMSHLQKKNLNQIALYCWNSVSQFLYFSFFPSFYFHSFSFLLKSRTTFKIQLKKKCTTRKNLVGITNASRHRIISKSQEIWWGISRTLSMLSCHVCGGTDVVKWHSASRDSQEPAAKS